MKKKFTSWAAALLFLNVPFATQAQVINGDFETQFSGKAPSQSGNVLSNDPGAAASAGGVDELPSWHSVGQPASFYAENASVYYMRPQQCLNGAFTSHGGQGCVEIERQANSYNGFHIIAQQVAVTAGHTYRASFYALRRPGYRTAVRLALAVTSSPPTYATDLSPSPYANIVSAPIGDTNSWMQVSGSFVAQSLRWSS